MRKKGRVVEQGFLFPDVWQAKMSARLVPHPIPYQGSKRQLAARILAYFPKTHTRLVEPFAGSAALSLAAAYYKRSCAFWINDAHRPLIDLWREIIDRPEDLATRYAALWSEQSGRERAFYDVIRGRFNKLPRPEYFLYLLARCVKAAIRYNSNGEFNNSPDNRRKGAKPPAMRSRLLGASRLLSGRTTITARDYRDILSECTGSDLVYLDPPYQGVCRNRDTRYAPQVNHADFCDALNVLNKRRCRYIVSYDGRTGEKVHGQRLPASLRLTHVELHAGRSTTATLLGRTDDTYESLYLSPSLADEAAFANSKGR